MSPLEWDSIPWVEQLIYIEGFRKEGILKDDSKPSSESAPAPSASGRTKTRKIDLTSADLSELSGFQTRRAG